LITLRIMRTALDQAYYWGPELGLINSLGLSTSPHWYL